MGIDQRFTFFENSENGVNVFIRDIIGITQAVLIAFEQNEKSVAARNVATVNRQFALTFRLRSNHADE